MTKPSMLLAWTFVVLTAITFADGPLASLESLLEGVEPREAAAETKPLAGPFWSLQRTNWPSLRYPSREHLAPVYEEQWASRSEMYYLRARYYNPEAGRFWTMDTFEGTNQNPLSLHKYLYCHGDPINGIDPSGHDLIGLMGNFYVKAQMATFTAFTTYGALTETMAMVTALSMLNSAQLLSTGIDPETGQPATAMATAFAVVDFLPAGNFITKPLKESTKRIYRRAALDIWDALSKVSRAEGHVHHRIGLEWAHLFPNMNPNRISNLKLVPQEIHEGVDGVSAAWTRFRNSLGGRTPTAQEVLDKAAEIDARFGQHFKDLE